MRFNAHSDIRDQHAFLSPSNYHWLGYDDQKLQARYHTVRAARRGTRLHSLAQTAIELGILLDESNGAISNYVRDAIVYGMSCEVPLYYSPNAFGHADAIGFKEDFLRVHDLKTGITKASNRQLEVYVALFCLEYGYDPYSIGFETRIYQRDEVLVFEGIPAAIEAIMEKIIDADRLIETFKEV